MKEPESSEERKKRFKRLSSKERRILIRKKLISQGLTEGSGVSEKDQTAYNKEEIVNLIILTRCLHNYKNEQ
tara:strand:+ start:4414 stop:4629 length:216 start_codon:yes stop_codon:yes gene_type:complete